MAAGCAQRLILATGHDRPASGQKPAACAVSIGAGLSFAQAPAGNARARAAAAEWSTYHGASRR
jgi:hypothetical protein